MERTHLYKAIRKDNGQWIEGNYVRQDDTTYCFKEDYDKHPENTKHYIVFDQSTDWGLPNRHLMTEVHGESVCEVVDRALTENGKRLFEHDVVTVTTSHYTFPQYEILWDNHEFCWVGERVGEKKNDGFDRIRLNSDWKYEYHGNTCERK